MAQVTSPIILDSTGQQIHSDLQQIKNVLTTPSAAADITFDNTGTGMQADDVQDAITELKSNLTELQVYSTTERVIGTWIDGSTIYRKSYSGNTVQNGNVILENSSNIAKIIKVSGSAISNYQWQWNIPMGGGDYECYVRKNTSNGQLQLHCSNNYTSSGTFVVTVDYTKSS